MKHYYQQQALKIIHSQVFFKDFAKSLSNFVHDFWKDCLRKPKLLLAPNMVIYLNTSTKSCIKNSRTLAPGSLGPHTLHRINTSEIQIRPVLKKSFLNMSAYA